MASKRIWKADRCLGTLMRRCERNRDHRGPCSFGLIDSARERRLLRLLKRARLWVADAVVGYEAYPEAPSNRMLRDIDSELARGKGAKRGK